MGSLNLSWCQIGDRFFCGCPFPCFDKQLFSFFPAACCSVLNVRTRPWWERRTETRGGGLETRSLMKHRGLFVRYNKPHPVNNTMRRRKLFPLAKMSHVANTHIYLHTYTHTLIFFLLWRHYLTNTVSVNTAADTQQEPADFRSFFFAVNSHIFLQLPQPQGLVRAGLRMAMAPNLYLISLYALNKTLP